MDTLFNLFRGSREREAYSILKSELPAGYRVFPQVRLADVIDIENPLLDQEDKSFALKSSFDLVVCDVGYWPVHAVELHGIYHQVEPQMTRDQRKRRICRTAGLLLTEVQSCSSSLRGDLLANVVAACQPGATYSRGPTALKVGKPVPGCVVSWMPPDPIGPPEWPPNKLQCYACGAEWTEPWCWANECLHCGSALGMFP